MITETKFWKDIEADDKMIKKLDKIVEKKDRKEFEKFEKRQRKDYFFWRKSKNDWL